MTSSDDFGLTRLFLRHPVGQATQEWMGGQMTAWNPVSYSNTVVVGPVTYTDLPVVSPNGLTEGPVLLARVANGLIVTGMLANVGGLQLDPIRYRGLLADIPSSSSTLIDAGVLNFLLNTDTQYALDGALFYDANSASDIKWGWSGPSNMSVKWCMRGQADAATNYTLLTTITDYGDANTQRNYGWGYSAQAAPRGWFATSDTPGLLQLRFAQGTTDATAALLQRGSWLRLSEIGPASGATTFIKLYAATASRSYNGSGNPIGGTDGDNNVYQGDGRDGYGNERSMLIFPGSTIRSDLTGATVLAARLFLYCFTVEETKGSLVEPRTESNTSVPATYNPTEDSPNTSLHDAWPVPGWESVECLLKGGADSLMNGILGGDNAVGLPPTTFGLAWTGFRGYGYSVSLRPYLQVTYAI